MKNDKMKNISLLLFIIPICIAVGFGAGKMSGTRLMIRESVYQMESASKDQKLKIKRDGKDFVSIHEESGSVSISCYNGSHLMFNSRADRLDSRQLKLTSVTFSSQGDNEPDKVGYYQWIASDYGGSAEELSGDDAGGRVRFYPDHSEE